MQYLFISIDGSDVISAAEVVDPRVSDHFLLATNVNTQLPRADTMSHVYRAICVVDIDEFATRIRQNDVYVNPSDEAGVDICASRTTRVDCQKSPEIRRQCGV